MELSIWSNLILIKISLYFPFLWWIHYSIDIGFSKTIYILYNTCRQGMQENSFYPWLVFLNIIGWIGTLKDREIRVANFVWNCPRHLGLYRLTVCYVHNEKYNNKKWKWEDIEWYVTSHIKLLRMQKYLLQFFMTLAVFHDSGNMGYPIFALVVSTFILRNLN